MNEGSMLFDHGVNGRIEYSTIDELKSFLKGGHVRISIKLYILETTGVKNVSVADQKGKRYALDGAAVKQVPARGMYINNGKKYIK